MKTTITPEQALEQIKKGHLSQLKGLDENDFTHVFDNANEVILLTYHQNSQTTPASVIMLNESEAVHPIPAGHQRMADLPVDQQGHGGCMAALSQSFQFHHVQMDGGHAAHFLDKLQKTINSAR